MSNFWEKKKVLITGGGGFLGRNIVEKIKGKGAILQIPRSKECDLVKPDNAWKMFESGTPDIVIHAAAVCGGIGANQKHPGKFFYDNMMMGLNVIHMAHLFKVEKIITIGTVCAYPKLAAVPFRESDIWSGYPEETNAPYGIAKKSLMVMSQAYRNEYGLNSIYLIPVNMYGPGDNFHTDTSHVIPALIKKFYEAKKANLKEVVCWGTGKATREFLYANDAAEAIVLAGEKYDKPEPMNLGNGFEISINRIAVMIADKIGYDGKIRWDTTKPDGQPRRCLDTSMAIKELGWTAKTTLDEGLDKTINWYKFCAGDEI